MKSLFSKILLVIVVVICSLYALAYFNSELVNDYFIEQESKDVVLSVLSDPDSAQFRNINGRCGEVNSKNRMGGYTGFDKFVVIGEKVYFESKEANLQVFWKNACPEK